jgi:hypothetical protein
MNYFKLITSDKQIQHLRQGGLMAMGIAAIATTLTLTTPQAANAQAAYGSYIGAGVAIGVTSGQQITFPNGATQDLEPSKTTAVLAARYKFLRVPISLRAQAMLGDGTAVVPTVSYDVPINWRTDVYLGAGASIPVSGDTTTPVGNQAAFVIQPGIDYVLPNTNFVLFGNAVIAFNAYRYSGGTAASLQAGVGLRF